MHAARPPRPAWGWWAGRIADYGRRVSRSIRWPPSTCSSGRNRSLVPKEPSDSAGSRQGRGGLASLACFVFRFDAMGMVNTTISYRIFEPVDGFFERRTRVGGGYGGWRVTDSQSAKHCDCHSRHRAIDLNGSGGRIHLVFNPSAASVLDLVLIWACGGPNQHTRHALSRNRTLARHVRQGWKTTILVSTRPARVSQPAGWQRDVPTMWEVCMSDSLNLDCPYFSYCIPPPSRPGS